MVKTGVRLLGALAAITALLACSSSADPVQPSLPPPSTTGPSASQLPEGVSVSIPLSDMRGPIGVAAVKGSLWVVDHTDGRASRIDPQTNRVVQTTDIGQWSCGVPIDAFGDLLTLPCSNSALSIVIDGSSGSLRGEIRDTAGSATAAAGSLWIASYDGKTLQRISPKTLKTQKVIRVDSGLTAFAGKLIWSAATDNQGAATGALVKIDPASDRVVGRYSLSPLGVTSMTYGFGALWFKPIQTPLLIRFDTLTGRTEDISIRNWSELSHFGDQPVAVGAGSLWIRARDGVVVRIDPETHQVVGQYPADEAGGGGFPLVAFGSLWVANYETSSVWRQQVRSTG